MSQKCVVQIVKDEGQEVVWQSEPTGRFSAEKIERGAQINLNWDTHHTRIVDARDQQERQAM